MRRYLLLILLFVLILHPIHAQDNETTAIPNAVALIDEGDQDITHILLIGAATEYSSNPGLTDTLMIVSVNPASQHIAIVSIPRDLYVYVPDFGMMKINQAYFLAEQRETGTGIATLNATVEHNLGIIIDFYARVNFDSFPDLVDSVGGIDITVDCSIEDWRLIEPDMDKTVEENWERFTLWSGLHHMDGDTALWYVRSRRSSSDFDRHRRQQDVLRALWRRIRSDGLLENFPQLWDQFNTLVDTDITLADAIQFLPSIIDLDASQVEYFTFAVNQQVTQGYTDDAAQRFILTPIPEAVATLMQQVVAPTTRSRLRTDSPTIAIYNGSNVPGLDYVAAHRLERDGFRTIITGEPATPRNYNLIVDHTGASRNNPIDVIQRTMRTTDEGVQTEPDPQRTYDYELYIGWNYQFVACTYAVEQPILDDENETAQSD
ncbi:MAG: LCP family protein [Phototrophicaceae bacterium]